MWRKRKSVEVKKVVPKSITPQQAMIRKQVVIGILLTLLLAGVLSFVGYITKLPSLQIQEIAVVGGITIPHSVIRQTVEGELIGTYLRLVPKRFRWLYPETAIKNRLETIDRVKQAHLEFDNEKNLVVAFEEYIPLGLWCKDIESTTCLFIDKTGLAFAPAPQLTGNAFVRYLTDDEPAVNTYITDQTYLDETQSFIEKLESELGLFVTHVIKAGDFDTEYQVAGGGRIKISQSVSADTSFRNLETILRSKDFTHIEPGTFNYIDLRFGDKVFINEVKEEPEPETESATMTEVDGGVEVQ